VCVCVCVRVHSHVALCGRRSPSQSPPFHGHSLLSTALRGTGMIRLLWASSDAATHETATLANAIGLLVVGTLLFGFLDGRH
jgi:hypothetical protein